MLDLDLYYLVFASGALLVWSRLSLYMAWLVCSSDNAVVHSNDQIAQALLNKREVWLKHSTSSGPMLQVARPEVLHMSDNVNLHSAHTSLEG